MNANNGDEHVKDRHARVCLARSGSNYGMARAEGSLGTGGRSLVTGAVCRVRAAGQDGQLVAGQGGRHARAHGQRGPEEDVRERAYSP